MYRVSRCGGTEGDSVLASFSSVLYVTTGGADVLVDYVDKYTTCC
jgi:hypothetical protein